MNTKQLIIFLIPPEKLVNGGIMSIFSLANETRKIKKNATVIISTYVGFPSYHKNDLFRNDEYIYDFDEIVDKFKNVKSLLIHVPELAVKKLHLKLPLYNPFLKNLEHLSINILNQNILFMPEKEEIFRLLEFTTNISQTTAHERYSSQETSNRFLLPLKHLSVFIDPSSYKKIPYVNKENLITYSRDERPEKELIINTLKKQLPHYSFKEIRDLTYEEYKEFIQKSKYTITFGEGLDGYFIESSFSGGVPIAVYNEDFFPQNTSLKKLDTLYDSYEELLNNVVKDIVNIDNLEKFSKSNSIAYDELSKIYSLPTYRAKISSFYDGNFDFTPSYDASSTDIKYLISTYLKEKRETVSELLETLESLRLHKESLKKRTATLDQILSSRAYKISKKLDKIVRKLRLK